MKDDLNPLIQSLSHYKSPTVRGFADFLRTHPRFIIEWQGLHRALGGKQHVRAAFDLAMEAAEKDDLPLPFDAFTLEMKDETGSFVAVIQRSDTPERKSFDFNMLLNRSNGDEHGGFVPRMYRIFEDRDWCDVFTYSPFGDLIKMSYDYHLHDEVDEVFAQMFLHMRLFLLLLRMRYVTTEIVDVVAINKRRARMNRLPLPAMHRVVIDLEKTTSVVRRMGGTHASPVGHVRRQHIRRLKSGKTVVVRSMAVNGGGENPPIYEVRT